MLGGMWRSALPVDDEAMVGMCVALNAEDPGPHPSSDDGLRKQGAVLFTSRTAPAP